MTSAWSDSIYWLKRGKLTSQVKLVVGVAVVLVSPIIVPWLFPSYSAIFAATGCAIILIYLFYSQYVLKRISIALGNAEVRESQHVATPFNSMFAALSRQNVSLGDIARLTVETGKFSNLLNYVNGDGKMLKVLLEQNPKIAVHIHGLNDLSHDHTLLRAQLTELGAPNIVFHDTKALAKTHRNIVRVKDGRVFIWFEEHHEIKDGHHYIPHGAHLLQVDGAAATKIETEVASGVPFQWWQTRAA